MQVIGLPFILFTYMLSSVIASITYYMVCFYIAGMENIGVAMGPSLEEVTLEPADPEELDKFLNDDNSEQKSRRDSCLTMENPVN